MGEPMRACLGIRPDLNEVGVFRYRTEVGGGPIENEYVHLFHGHFDGEMTPDPAEVMGVQWASLREVQERVARSEVAPWFRLYIAECPSFLHV